MNPITAIKTILDMIFGRKPFDSVSAAAAVLDIAQATMTVFTTKSHVSKVYTQAERQEIIAKELSMLLPPEGAEVTTSTFMIPPQITQMLFMWLLQAIVDAGIKAIKQSD